MKKAQDEKIRQKQADDDEYFMEFEEMDIRKKDKKSSKTKHGMEKHEKDKVKSKPSQQKSKPKSTPGCVS
ncbi:hypothetical protein Tco_0407154 [Tanacetum coccineum]